MSFTVALVGGDGAGKTSIARRLEESPVLRCKYLYMGQSILSSNAALPTSRLVRSLKLRAARERGRRHGARLEGPGSDDLHYAKKARGPVRMAASLANRLAEASWRQLLSLVYRRRGRIVVYDRHFVVESALAITARGSKRPTQIERFEYWLLSRFYPRPDLVIFLDAPPAVLFERKGEWSIAQLASRRMAMLEHGRHLSNFVVVDAARPIDQVLADVTRELTTFRDATAQRRNGPLSRTRTVEPSRPRRASAATRVRKPAAIVVGLDHLNGVQTARILAGHGVPVIGIARDPRHYGCRTRVCQKIHFVDAGDEALIEALEQLGPSLGQKAVLVPCTDMQVLLLSSVRDRLTRWYHLVLPQHETVQLLMDKVAFYSYAHQNGFPIPRTAFLRGRAEAEEAAQVLRFPIVLKPPLSADPRWEEHSRLKAYILSTPAQLAAAYDRLSPLADVLIAQEWIEGPISNLYSCNCYFDRHGRPVATFVSRKLRQWPPQTGESSLGEECRNDVVLAETIRLFKSVAFRGLGYLEMKQDARTGDHFIMEPNVGRPTGRSPIAEAGGVELMYAMYCDALGWPLPTALEQRYGKAKWMDIRRDVQSAFSEWRDGDLTLGEWWRSVRGPKTYALFSLADPGPFLGDLERGLRLLLSPAERRKRDYRRAASQATSTTIIH